MSVKVRNALESDIAALHAIYAHHVEHGVASFELTAPDEAEIARRREAPVAAGFAAAGP